ncbi:MAG: hypothetical protein ACI4RA_09560 [Kiritimatiellia bacterium]
MEKWYVRNAAGKVFGPIDLETLKSWVKDGRVEPLAGVSTDLVNWVLAPMKPELEMNWVVENNPGQFYGPTHRTVVDDLVKTGSISREARFYQDDRGATFERIRALEALVAAKEAEVARRDVALAEAQKQAAKRDLALAAAQRAVAQRDDRIAESVAALAQRDGQIDTLAKTLKTKEGDLVRAAGDLARRGAEISRLQEELQRKEEEIAELRDQMAAKDAVHEREWKTDVVVPEVVVDEMPPPTARNAFGFGMTTGSTPARSAAPSSLADLERRAQEELARMGASGAKRFFNFKK